jgi:hypothetical protein
MKTASQLDQLETEIEDIIHQQKLDHDTLRKTILETAGNGGLRPDKPPQSLWHWNIHRIRRMCMMLEELGLLVWTDGMYVRNEKK